MPKRKRGPYKKYLVNENVEVPGTTKYYRRNENNDNHIEQESSEYDSDIEIEDQFIDDEYTGDENVDQPTQRHLNIINDDPINERDLSDDMIQNNDNACNVYKDDSDSTSSNHSNSDDVEDNDGLNDNYIQLSESDSGSDYDDLNDNEMYNDFNEHITVDNIEEVVEVNKLDQPLYVGCDLTRAESELLLMSVSLRNSFTQTALGHLLKLIDYCHLPQIEYCSKYLFLKSFKDAIAIEHYVCSDCSCEITFDNNVGRSEWRYCEKVCIKRANKPNMNTFLRPFVEELIELNSLGFDCNTYISDETKNVKVHVMYAPVDSVARPLVQNIKQYNGKFGCSYSLHKGETVPMGRGFARIYRKNIRNLRTHKQHIQNVKLAVENDQIVKGVKGPSIILKIPNFDIIDGFPPDYMHAVLLEVVKLFCREWFDTKNNNKDWYVGHKAKIVNKRLLSIKPPVEITRTPRPITDSHYKANEWKTMLLYYIIPCLINIMPKKYLQHFMLFVYSMRTFLQMKITDQQFLSAEMALTNFVFNIEKLYGKKFMKYNVHLLLHTPKYVKKYGALWAWSAFPYEGFNGVIKKLFHGTQSISLQICKTYTTIRNVRLNSTVFSHPNCSKDGRNFFISLMNECRMGNCIEYGNYLRIFGKPQYKELTLNEKLTIEDVLDYNVENIVKCYHKFIYKNRMFHTINYNRMTKRQNYTILTNEQKIIRLTYLMAVRRENTDKDVYIVLGSMMQITNEEICKNESVSSTLFCYVTKETSMCTCIRIQNIESKCVEILYDNKFIVTPIVNTLETD